jgi:mono/diheme cytochrome c family protein
VEDRRGVHDSPEVLSVPDLPERDPGLPRFIMVMAVLVAAGALWLVVRPVSVEPLDEAPVVSAAVEPEEAGDASGGMLFVREGCGACHATAGPSTALGPTLSDAARNADDRIRSPEYAGHAEDAGAYLREATLDHCADILPGYECVEVSEVGLRLSAAEIEKLVEFMSGLGAEAES